MDDMVKEAKMHIEKAEDILKISLGVDNIHINSCERIRQEIESTKKYINEGVIDDIIRRKILINSGTWN